MRTRFIERCGAAVGQVTLGVLGGTLAGGALGVLAGAIFGLIYLTPQRIPALGLRGALAGAVAGGFLGICWAMEAAWQRLERADSVDPAEIFPRRSRKEDVGLDVPPLPRLFLPQR
ncbi:MAG: hypothetical protein JO112_02255 [Planctomycetes bacterium]|nr:hypothetical protein [Planctomycetota bacterium]